MKRRVISLILCLSLLLSCMGLVFAADSAVQDNTETQPMYDIIEQEGIHYVRVSEYGSLIGVGDTTEVAGVAVYQAYTDAQNVTIPNAVADPNTGKQLPVMALLNGAFGGNTHLETIEIPDSVQQIGYDTWIACEQLNQISVDENNVNYSSQDGVLYDKGKTQLIVCPMAKSGVLTVAPGVTKIRSDALAECTQLTEVILPDTLKSIGICAFSACTGLTELVIPSSVEKMDDYAFEWCSGLKTIRFLGDPPYLGENVFDGVTAVVYYPADWTELPDAAGVGGTLDWEPALSEVANLNAVSTSYNSAKISWDAVSGAEGYVVYRKNGSSWKRLGTTTGTTYTQTGLSCGTTYTYTVRAYKIVYGVEKKGGYDPKGVSVRVVPNTVVLNKATVSRNSIKITWNAVSGIHGYTVYRKQPSAEKWKNLKSVSSSVTSYTDSGLEAGKYIYTVRAYRTVSGEKVLGGYDATGISANIVPATPRLSSISGSASQITVKWNKVSGADGYRFYRKTGNGGWKYIESVTGENTVTYQDTTIVPGNTYTYTVRAFIMDGEEIVPSSYDAKGLSVAIAEQPILVSAVETVSSNQMSVNVKWERANNAAGYVVYRLGDHDTKWRRLATLSGSSTTSYRDSKPEGGVHYAYTVRAYTKAGTSEILSTYDSVGVCAFIPARTVLKSASVTPDNAITVKWSPVADAEGYRVYRKSNKNTTWKTVAVLSGESVVSYVDTELENGLTYVYTVRAYVTRNGQQLLGTYDPAGVSTYYMDAPNITLEYDFTREDLYIRWTSVAEADGYVIYGLGPKDSKWVRKEKIANAKLDWDDGTYLEIWRDFDISEEYRITIRPYQTIGGKEVLGSYLKSGVSTNNVQDRT